MTTDPHAAIREHVRTVTGRAWEGLRHSQNLQPPLIDDRGLRFGRPRLQLWRDAAGFHDYEPQTLTVFQPFDDGVAPLLRRAVWNRSEDQRPLHEVFERRSRRGLPEPLPTFEVSDTRIDRAGFEALLDEAHGLRIPIVWPWPTDRDSLTEDVGMIGFEHFDIAEPQASLRCSWSFDVPTEWEAVTNWYGRMFEWLESHFGET